MVGGWAGGWKTYLQREGSEHLMLAHLFQAFHPKTIGGLKKLEGSLQVHSDGCGWVGEWVGGWVGGLDGMIG